jgi:hypothetical protein
MVFLLSLFSFIYLFLQVSLIFLPAIYLFYFIYLSSCAIIYSLLLNSLHFSTNTIS